MSLRHFLLLFLILCSCSGFAYDFSAKNEEGVTIYYNINSDDTTVSVTYKIYNYKNIYSGDIVIPESVTYSDKTYSVTAIGVEAFSGCNTLTSVIIPNSVFAIDKSAFSGCFSLTTITIPNSVSSIGASAFYNCYGLSSLTIPESVVSIGDHAFSHCSGIRAVVIPESINSISSSAFSSCTGLATLSIPQSVTSIGDNAFENCIGLTSLNFSNSVISIGAYAFYGCRGLTSLTIPDSVTTIGDSAFSDCDYLNSVVIGNSVTSLGKSVFYNCIRLNSINIPNSVVEIGESAFQYCDGMRSVKIGNSVSIIGNYAFCGCNHMVSLTLGNSIAYIGEGAFSTCWNLKSLILPNSVTTIGDSAFNDCVGLTSVFIPSSVNTIGNYAFNNCSNLIKSAYPSNLNNPFTGSIAICYPIEDSIIEDCIIWTKDKTKILFMPLDFDGDFEIPNSVTIIDKYAFYGCDHLSSVTIPNSVTDINSSAFANCRSLSSVALGNSISSIGEFAFSNCEELTSIIIPRSVNDINFAAFRNCPKLMTATFENETPISTWENIFPWHALNVYVPSQDYTTENNELHLINYIGTNGILKEEGINYLTLGSNQYVAVDAEGQLPATVHIKDGTTQISNNLLKDHREVQSLIFPNSLTILPELPNDLRSITVGQNVTSFSYTSDNKFCKYFMLPNDRPSQFQIDQNDPIVYTANSSYGNLTMPQLSSLFEAGGIRYVPVSLSDRTCMAVDVIYERGRVEYTVPAKVTYKNVEFSVIGIGDGLFAGSQASEFNLQLETDIIPQAYCYDCVNLKNIEFPNTVQSVGNSAFENCLSLTSLNIPCSITLIGSNAFSDCYNLQSLHIDDGNNILNLSSFYLSYYPFVNCKIKNLYIGRDISAWFALCNSSSLREVEISDSVTSIGELAFKDCSGLSTVNIPNSVTTIGDHAFSGCTGLTSMILGDFVTSIGTEIFSNCCNLSSIRIGNSITSISEYAFYNCSSLNTISFGNSINSIGRAAFSMCSNLNSISIPSSVTSIGAYAFSDCCGLTTLIIPNSVTLIGTYAFYNCSNLSSILIGNSVASIGDACFYKCNSLKNIIIPKSVTYIGDNAFLDCISLTQAYLQDGFDNIKCGTHLFDGSSLEEVQIGRNIKGEPFRELSTLKTSWITDIVTEIPDYLFYHCSGLENLYIGDEVSRISDWAFSGCYGLKLFNFGKNITEIGNNALSDCSGIVDIYAEPTVPPTVYTQGLDDINKWECTLHYPAGAPYNTALQWKEFLLTDNDFMVTMPEETMESEADDVITVTANVADTINPEEVVWRSSNPDVAEIVEGENLQSAPARSASSTNTISVKVLVHKKEQATIAVFLPTGQMANCIINKGQMSTSVQDISITPFNYGDDYNVYNLQGVLVLRTSDSEQLNNLPSGIYIINDKKVMVR